RPGLYHYLCPARRRLATAAGGALARKEKPVDKLKKAVHKAWATLMNDSEWLDEREEDLSLRIIEGRASEEEIVEFYQAGLDGVCKYLDEESRAALEQLSNEDFFSLIQDAISKDREHYAKGLGAQGSEN
ncbi:MAG: hypothetical protein ACYTG0_40535, partial [Planctomycetota bacterium]